MNNKRMLFLTLILATLSIGVIIGTIVSGGVKATAEQKPATLVIPDPVSLSNAFSQISAQLEPAVVRIDTESTIQAPAIPRGGGGQNRRGQQAPPSQSPFDDFFNFFGGGGDATPRKAQSLGSGFILDKAGYILTNNHVVDKADKIKVVLDDKSEYPAKLIGADKGTDLAVVKIETGKDLPIAKLGNSDAVKVGDWVLAIGSPFEFDHTVTAGIISAVGRGGNQFRESGDPEQGAFQSFLQTDAAINPGNSGGPLVNMAGEVIGINTAIISETRQFAGLGFALPSNIAVKVYNQLVSNGKVTRGSIGITYNSEPSAATLRSFGLKSGEGVIVESVYPGSPAAKAGLKEDDVITEINGKKITGGSVLLDIVANTAIGNTIQMKVVRNGREMSVPVAVGDRADIIARESGPNDGSPRGRGGRGQGGPSAESQLGIDVQAITPADMRRFGLSNAEGVLITNVDQNSPAEEAGLEPGMVITGVVAAGRSSQILSLDDFRNAEKGWRPGTDVSLRIMVRDPNTGRFRSALRTVTIP
jgi:serine protease Do